ncbi:MAG TPA: hypothetical protein VFB73_01435 [Chloroflexota bacterium]|nr:hypothetical protein [Chloroflexota bacterium]
MEPWTIYDIDPLDLGRTTLFCFVFLPLLFGLLILWCQSHARILQEVWRAFFEVFDPEHPERMELFRDRFGWFIRERWSGVVWSENPFFLRYQDEAGRWIVKDRLTGQVLRRSRWPRATVRHPLPGQKASLFRLRE